MNILMLLFKDIHFDARVKREAFALAKNGHQVVIACLEEYDTTPPFIHENIQLMRLSISTKRMKRTMEAEGSMKGSKKNIFKLVRTPFLKLFKDIWANIEYTQLIKKAMPFKPDVIHCHDLNTLPTGAYLNRMMKSKFVYDSHELFNEMASKKPFEKKVGYSIEKMLIKKIDHLITVNPFVYEEFQKRYGSIPVTTIQNIPLIVKSNDEPLPSNYFQQMFNIQADQRILLYQGGINPERGIEKCVEALTHLDERYVMILLGTGRIIEQLKRQIQHLGLQHRVFFHEQVPSEQLASYTKQAHIGLVLYENTCLNNYLSTPNKIFEYLQAGIPTVASNHPGKSYIIHDYQTGVTVEENAEAIAQGVLAVEAKYHFYAQKCFEASAVLRWDNEASKLNKLYASLQKES